MFVDNNVYRWGILDEVATTAFYVGKIHMGFMACEKLLNENLIPQEHRARIQSNRDSYIKVMSQIQQQMNQHAFDKMKNVNNVVQNIPEPPKSLLNIDPKKLALKL